jgi:hypothetical protein
MVFSGIAMEVNLKVVKSFGEAKPCGYCASSRAGLADFVTDREAEVFMSRGSQGLDKC